MRDEQFIRGKVPMTKSEVRAVSLSKFEFGESGVFYDIGAGTGSVSIEAAMQLRHGQVYAIEQKEEGCELILANKVKFGLENLTIVNGTAPECLNLLPVPDCVFIGGSSGRFSDIMEAVEQKNPNVRIVLGVIALESLAQVVQWIKEKGKQAEIVSVQIAKARKVADYHLMEGTNPVYVISMGGAYEAKDT